METTSNKTLKSGIDLVIVIIIFTFCGILLIQSIQDENQLKLQKSIDSVNVQIKKLRIQLYNADTITHKPNSIPNNIKQIKYE